MYARAGTEKNTSETSLCSDSMGLKNYFEQLLEQWTWCTQYNIMCLHFLIIFTSQDYVFSDIHTSYQKIIELLFSFNKLWECECLLLLKISLKNGLDAFGSTLWAWNCFLSSQARVTSAKSWPSNILFYCVCLLPACFILTGGLCVNDYLFLGRTCHNFDR